MDRRTFNRRLLAGGAVAATGATSLSLATATGPASAAETAPRTAPAGGAVRTVKLYAEKLADGKMGYGLEKGKASVPGPLIELTEGDTLHIEFENTMDVDASLHVHGVDYDVASDGTRLNKSHVEPGGTRTYTWRTHAPGRRKDGTYQAGSAGYWHYHDHVVGTDHGTGGIRNGLYGGVVVRRKGDLLPDRTFTIVFNDMTINNQPPHSGPDLKATVGDRVEIVMITHGEYYHTFHMHGHRWADNRTGMLAGPDDPSRVVDTKIVGPADSFGFQILAGEHVGAGAWMYHCHVQSHSDMGMAGLFLVAKPDGTIPGYEPHHPA
ncbi:multicopper oxidase domain-containing protein [Streptomyces sp. NBC_01387]|uniref:multicopper oxidase domain-containing protein n=1 Tax=unclassified Streptomyces TaxID=2593676 RepID=UPI002024E518|nr:MULTISPECIES: multicopper oxidase domain-containing protein [unclassified Streptomyces]MCX4553810.1 multicopper oxidase domain-containing protein [Streptomyces sp. NBC_01500]WSC18725.1 multicopper oxidase domain-containing protein [Streptomyces sp. NBC_01766]WSV52759.1 multicopper oxidase domain-containing protein [Streptomyces sp. NBC_01014]